MTVRRFGSEAALFSAIFPFLVYFSLSALLFSAVWGDVMEYKNNVLMTAGFFAAWRYSWALNHYLRAFVYANFRYPWLRKRACALPEDKAFPSHIYFVIPSYKEEPWVSIECMQSILSNLSELPMTATLIIATGDDRDDLVISRACDSHPSNNKVDVILQRQKDGKRLAMGHALRAVARRYDNDPNSVTVFMDGDSYLETDCMRKLIPYFALLPKLGAVTTNEVAFIHTRSQLYKDWFNLKFGQRHVLFQSHAMSNKVMTLTGRFSVFRTSIVVQEDFIKAMEFDAITHWRHGKFRFLMGDDKSSWFYLLRNHWNMLYLPDVLCYSLESRDADFFQVSRSLPYRWYGNTLRNNDRAIKLGPKVTGIFIWLCILDQRMNMWTSLVGLAGALLLAMTKAFVFFPFYLAWVFFVRCMQMLVIAAAGHPVSLLTIPLMLYSQWVGAFVKIKAFYNLSDQNWSKGKSTQKVKTNIYVPSPGWAVLVPKISMISGYILFLGLLLLSDGIVRIPVNPGLFFAASPKILTVNAEVYGVIANDGQDDSASLQSLLDWVAAYPGSRIQLPAGEINLDKPVLIQAGNITLAGQGAEKTRIVSRIKGVDLAVIDIQGQRSGAGLPISRHFRRGELQIRPQSLKDLSEGMLVLIRIPNNDTFLQALGSRKWNQQYPYVRQQLVPITAIDHTSGVVTLADGLLFDSDDGAELVRLDPVEHVILQDFSIQQQIPGAVINSVKGVYENRYPQYLVDEIRTRFVRDLEFTNLMLLDSGRNPLAMEYCYHCVGQGVTADGAWNKGDKGSGYVRFNKTFNARFDDLTLRNIRHLVFQWSSANNHVTNSHLAVDVNFHGGFSQHNRVDNVTWQIPDFHKWGEITRTADDAHWAPPDGPDNEASGIIH